MAASSGKHSSGKRGSVNHGPRRVVIVGGGFGGLFAARALGHDVSVTLIDRAHHHLFQPLLYQCATGILSEGQIAAPLRSVLKRHKNIECAMAEVTGIDTAARRVIAVRPGGGRIEFGYDDLIVAAGMRQSYFGHDEFAKFAPGMKSIADVLTIRRRVFGAFEMAETSDDPAERRRWLTFALVGAGPTGVELAGQIRELATKTLHAEYRKAKPEDARVLLFDGGSAPLAAFGPKLSAKARKSLGKLGVEMHMGSIVTDIDFNGLAVRDHEGTVTRYDVGTVLWTAGVEASAFAKALADATGAETDRWTISPNLRETTVALVDLNESADRKVNDGLSALWWHGTQGDLPGLLGMHVDALRGGPDGAAPVGPVRPGVPDRRSSVRSAVPGRRARRHRDALPDLHCFRDRHLRRLRNSAVRKLRTSLPRCVSVRSVPPG